MLRKIILLVPAVALAFLAVSRLGGLAGKIGTDGLAWAQDAPADDVGDSNSSKYTKVKFNGSSSFDATPSTPCSYYACYSVSGSVTPTSMPTLGTGEMAGEAHLDKCKINKKARSGCCTFGSAQTYTFSGGDYLDVSLAGKACGKSVTNVTAKNVKFNVTGGGGLFANASGGGRATLHIDESAGTGSASFKGTLKFPQQ